MHSTPVSDRRRCRPVPSTIPGQPHPEHASAHRAFRRIVAEPPGSGSRLRPPAAIGRTPPGEPLVDGPRTPERSTWSSLVPYRRCRRCSRSPSRWLRYRRTLSAQPPARPSCQVTDWRVDLPTRFEVSWHASHGRRTIQVEVLCKPDGIKVRHLRVLYIDIDLQEALLPRGSKASHALPGLRRAPPTGASA